MIFIPFCIHRFHFVSFRIVSFYSTVLIGSTCVVVWFVNVLHWHLIWLLMPISLVATCVPPHIFEIIFFDWCKTVWIFHINYARQRHETKSSALTMLTVTKAVQFTSWLFRADHVNMGQKMRPQEIHISYFNLLKNECDSHDILHMEQQMKTSEYSKAQYP